MRQAKLDFPVRVTVTMSKEGNSAIGQAQNMCREYRDIDKVVLAAREELERALYAPTWSDYDVISVQFQDNGPWYTYMRRDGYWPGKTSWSEKTDEQINALYARGQVKLLVRDSKQWDQAATP
jgi:hypothetical protein